MSTAQQLEQYSFKQTRFYNIPILSQYLSGDSFGSPHARRSNYMHMHTREKKSFSPTANTASTQPTQSTNAQSTQPTMFFNVASFFSLLSSDPNFSPQHKYGLIPILVINQIQASSHREFSETSPLGVVGCKFISNLAPLGLQQSRSLLTCAVSRSTVILLCNRKVPSSILGAEKPFFLASA
jgi:hypothetical protein